MMRISFERLLSDQLNAETTSKVITLIPTYQDVETSTGQLSRHLIIHQPFNLDQATLHN